MNRTVLLIAISLDKLAFVQVLASQGASLNQKVEGTKITPLHAAIGNGNVEVTRFLLDCGADVKQANKQKELPLHYAAQEGHSTIFRLLAEHGSPLESPTKKGIRPAHLAAKGGHVDILRQLHGRGASLNISAKENQSEDASVPETPLHFAAATGQQEAVQFLLSRCVKLKEDARNDRSILDVSADSASVLESLRVYRLTENPELLCQAALFALKHDNPSTLRILMSWGITPNTDLGMGQFLLHWAARFGAVQCTAFLLVQGADPFLTDAEGQTPLEVAAANNSSEQFEQLLEFCRYLPEFDIDRVNSRGETLVHIAAKAGNLPHLCSLTWYGASLSLQNVQLSTPLDLLLFHVSEQTDPVLNMKWVQAAKFLFVCGGEISQAKENHPLLTSFYAAQQPGDSPLHLAVRLQVSHAIELLVALLDVNTQNDKGMSSLHVAAEQGYLSGAVALLKAGADVKLHDAQGRIPVHLSSHDATVRLLKSHKGA